MADFRGTKRPVLSQVFGVSGRLKLISVFMKEGENADTTLMRLNPVNALIDRIIWPIAALQEVLVNARYIDVEACMT